MFTLMNSDSLWIGKDLQKFNRLRDCLDQAGIPYSHKTRNRMGQWNGQGTVRGRMGGLGTTGEGDYEYELLVYKKDLEKAKKLTGLI